MAPMLPFLTEDMCQNLVIAGGSEPKGPTERDAIPESVHLTDWPAADETLIDHDLSESIHLIQRLSSLGRAARARANVKVRQPLQTVFVKTASQKEQEIIQAMADQLLEELNVKELRIIADETEYFDYQVRPNLPVLGPKYGGEVGRIQRVLASANGIEIARQVEAGHQVLLDSFTLEPSELLLSKQGKPGYAAAEEGGYAAVVTTMITPELADEGVARELIRRIQEMRKSAGFKISDRIRFSYKGDDLDRVIQSWHRYIAEETLAESVQSAEPPAGAYTEDHEIDGRKVTLAVERSG
jgi:isoleucyl-tRNA synthetase